MNWERPRAVCRPEVFSDFGSSYATDSSFLNCPRVGPFGSASLCPPTCILIAPAEIEKHRGVVLLREGPGDCQQGSRPLLVDVATCSPVRADGPSRAGPPYLRRGSTWGARRSVLLPIFLLSGISTARWAVVPPSREFPVGESRGRALGQVGMPSFPCPSRRPEPGFSLPLKGSPRTPGA